MEESKVILADRTIAPDGVTVMYIITKDSDIMDFKPPETDAIVCHPVENGKEDREYIIYIPKGNSEAKTLYTQLKEIYDCVPVELEYEDKWNYLLRTTEAKLLA